MTQESPNQTSLGSDAFVSYASQDAAVANSIVENIESQGLRCWMAPRDVKPGTVYAEAIVRAINESSTLVLVLSAAAMASAHVGREVERAASKHKQIIAFRIDASSLSPELEYFLSNSQWIDVPALGMSAALAKLNGAVGQHLATSSQANPELGGDTSGRSIIPRAVGAAAIAKRVAVAGAIVVGLGVVGSVAVHFWPSKQRDAQAPALVAISDKSIAVLPFVDMSETKDQEYFSDGLSEELIDLLAQTPDLRVIARTSSFYFKGKQVTIAEIAKTLGVAHVLEGSVRKSGTTLRVTAQLISADTGLHLWSKTYDRDVKEIFKVQDDVAAAVVEALKAKLLPARPPENARRTDNSEAYDQYLIGRQFFSRQSREGWRLALSAYRRSIGLDDHFAAAYAALAETEAVVADDDTGDAAGFNRAIEAAERAVALGPDIADGYAVRGWLRYAYSWNWAGAQSDIEKAMAYDVGSSTVQLRYSTLLGALGRIPDAIAAAQKAIKADPLSAAAWVESARWFINSRRFAAAREALNRALEITPESLWAFYRLEQTEVLDGHAEKALARATSGQPDQRLIFTALAAHTLGRGAESDQALTALISQYALLDAYQIAEIYAWRGKTDKTLEWLGRSYAQHDFGLIDIKTDPFMTAVRPDPRFKAFLRKMNLSE
jgi:TolB-like protein/Tfp pilus assembly protein PilF